MIAWLFLFGAIASEVTATLCLKVAAEGRKSLYPVVIMGYLFAFICLSYALIHGMGLGLAYGVWSAVGVAITALLSHLIFKEPLTPLMLAGIGLIMGGVLLVELGASH